MKKTLVLAAAILAASMLHISAGASSLTEPTILQAGKVRIPHGLVCGLTPTSLTPTGGSDSVVILATMQGPTGQFVTDAELRQTTLFPGYTEGVQVCINAPARELSSTGPDWVSYVVIGPPPAA